MKRFELESPMFEGKVVFCFDDQTERLSIVDMSGANLSEEQWRGIWENLPATPQMLDRVKAPKGFLVSLPSYSRTIPCNNAWLLADIEIIIKVKTITIFLITLPFF